MILIFVASNETYVNHFSNHSKSVRFKILHFEYSGYLYLHFGLSNLTIQVLCGGDVGRFEYLINTSW